MGSLPDVRYSRVGFNYKGHAFLGPKKSLTDGIERAKRICLCKELYMAIHWMKVTVAHSMYVMS